LRRADFYDQVIQAGIQLGIGFHGQRIRRAFENLLRVGIVKRVGGQLRVGEFLPAQHLRRYEPARRPSKSALPTTILTDTDAKRILALRILAVMAIFSSTPVFTAKSCL